MRREPIIPIAMEISVKQVADLIVRSAHLRHESRGLHYSLDYPEKTNLPQPTILTPAG